jgi:hypothetical protein
MVREKGIGLGVDFTFRIESAIAAILGDPERRSDRQYGPRYWPVEQFPHLILYDVTETEILLFGVTDVLPRTRELLGLIVTLVDERREAGDIEPCFTQRQLRETFGWGELPSGGTSSGLLN